MPHTLCVCACVWQLSPFAQASLQAELLPLLSAVSVQEMQWHAVMADAWQQCVCCPSIAVKHPMLCQPQSKLLVSLFLPALLMCLDLTEKRLDSAVSASDTVCPGCLSGCA